MPPVVQIRNLCHAYGKKEIYNDLNLTIEAGSVFGILGKNGVGKSTLINLLMGYLLPQKGECLLFGEPTHSLSVHTKQKIALLHEGFVAYDFFTIAQYETFLASFYPRWKKEYFYTLVDLAKLDHFQRLSTLSFGQKSQVVLGAIFAQDAQLLILDDYSMGLDLGYRRLFIDYLKDHLHTTGKTVLMTSHVMGELVGLIDHMLIVRKGGAVYHNTIEAFLDTFHCYAFEENDPLEHVTIHRIERHAGVRKLFTFDHLPHYRTLPCDFEEKFLGFVGKYE